MQILQILNNERGKDNQSQNVQHFKQKQSILFYSKVKSKIGSYYLNQPIILFKANQMIRNKEVPLPLQPETEDIVNRIIDHQSRQKSNSQNYNASLMKILADVLTSIINQNQQSSDADLNQQLGKYNPDFRDDRQSQSRCFRNKTATKGQNKRGTKATPKATQQTLSAKRYELEVRDREVIVEPPAMNSEQTRKSELKKWASKIMKNVSSASFHYCSKNEMTFEQAKVYCSENILKNLALLGFSKSLRGQDFEVIDNYIKTKQIGYLMAKYPKTDSTDLNKKLSSQIQEVDNIQTMENNYIDNSKIRFQYRSDGNYNDLIMRFINELSKLVEGKSGDSVGDKEGEEKTNYKDFKDYMSNIFEKVESEEWVNRQYKKKVKDGQNGIHEFEWIYEESFDKQYQIGCWNHQGQRKEKSSHNYIDGQINRQASNEKMRKQMQEYKEKVKQYTSYLIGRKIPENFTDYSEDEIKSKNMIIKSPAVLRILTKWCEELMRPFQNDNYYSDRSESIRLQIGDDISIPDRTKRKQIDRLLRMEREDIQKYKEELDKHNYQMQANFLNYQLKGADQGDEHVDFLEKISGKFSIKTANNLHSYIIFLLNRLIHGLMQVARRHYTSKAQTHFDYSPCPLNLLAFRVGDLMRCRFSSHQEQVFLIFKELQKRSKNEPKKLRIIRIKNRLGTGNNDILINVKFNNKVTCEVQLAVNAKTSSFIQTSNKFNHYFYELKRSAFGPLTQLCSIWRSQDQKSNIYQQLINGENLTKEANTHICKEDEYEMLEYERPFICGQCNCTYFHNNYICSHTCCSKCGFYQCFRCGLSHETEQNLIDSYITDVHLRKSCKKRVQDPDSLPELGVCIYLEQKQPKMELFTYFIEQSGKKYIFSKKGDGEIYQIQKIATKEEMEAFISKYLIFQLKFSEQHTISKDDIEQKYFLPKLIKNNYQKQKESLLLMNQNLNTKKCKEFLDIGKKKEKQKVKNLFLEGNQNLQDIFFESEEYPNLNSLTISGNIKNLSKLGNFKSLTNFKAQKCHITSIPTEFFQLQNMERLDFSNNEIQRVPEDIQKFKKLKRLEIKYNQPLISLSEGLCQCLNLQYVNINTCQKLEKLPNNIHRLQKLETLICNHTKIGSLPQSIGHLKALTKLKIFNAPLSELPNFLFDLETLQQINFSGTQITVIPGLIQKLAHLQVVSFKKCQKITCLPPQFMRLKHLRKMDFSKSSNIKLPKNIGQLTQLKSIQFAECNLQELPQSFKNLKHLKKMDFSKNKLARMDPSLFTNLLQLQELILEKSGFVSLPNLQKCQKLIKLNLNQNKIKEIPDNYMINLTNLEDLKINKNQLRFIPSSILQLNRLMILSAQSNHLQNFSEKELSQLQNQHKSRNFLSKLTDVNLKQNDLTQFPYWILKCHNLRKLSLQNNQISIVPRQIQNLINLKELAMDHSQIRQLPAQNMDKMNLEIISLSSNKITKIPDQFRKMSKLKKLYMKDNPVETYENLEWILDKNIDCDFKESIEARSPGRLKRSLNSVENSKKQGNMKSSQRTAFNFSITDSKSFMKDK